MEAETPKPEADKKRGRGRPPKFDATIAEEIVRHMRDGLFLETACGLVGISASTARAWLTTGARGGSKPHTEFSAAVKRARAEAEKELLEGMRTRAAIEGDWKERAWRLERLDPRKYGPKVIVEFRALVDDFLAHLEQHLDEDTFERVCSVASCFDGSESKSGDDEI